eukprot:TRINITY_DN10928_c1_g1_i1.p1 TRINITY_DN10928_c1_g1~~TRINITY_DN10928_c1_g1_i1.p1  ORF type:complete len:421 (-),score=55.25 TRINITY_DN10928_c1_g1_i1:536-1798(-)
MKQIFAMGASPNFPSNELPFSHSPALDFKVLAKQGRARTASMVLPHQTCTTPMFMPVGTQGTVKGLTSQQLKDTNCQVILGNTYHLENRPGSELIDRMGGLHKFVGWQGGMLTDSGGFQMVSLLHLADIEEEGVAFQSPIDGHRMMLTPELSIGIQNRLGADIIMQLDDVVPSTNADRDRFLEATYRTTRWLDRCVQAHARKDQQSLFPIVQGGLDPELRAISLKQLVERDMPGYAVGGLAGGEDKNSFWKVVSQCTQGLPENKPRYVMGIGNPLDVVICTALGADMYDSVYPTRTARFGVALVDEGVLKLKNATYAKDFRPIDEDCTCMTCKHYTRALLHTVVGRNIAYASILVTYHNVAYMQRLTTRMQLALQEGTFDDFVANYIQTQFPEVEDTPKWVVDACEAAGITLKQKAKVCV